ncbi:MAG: flavodoxin family protein [Eubacteriales bacterium]|nr:flavodoxin family protein [Eubacteriales bacterium]
MSRIVVLVGSVRRGGNTELLAKAFADGAGRNHEVELVSVADYRIHPCCGCNHCYTSDGNRCAQKDDMTVIYEKLRQADTVVIASPVYFYGISAQLKALVDRLHTPMRNEFRIKRLGLILVGAATLPDLFDPILLQYRMILRFFGLEDIGTVLVSGARDKGDVLRGDGPERAFELGRSLR